MGSVTDSVLVDAPTGAVFDYVADYTTATAYMQGLTHWDPVDGDVYGLGARFDCGLRLGPKTFESRIEIDRWEPGVLIGWTAVSGFPQSGLQRLAPEEGLTRVTFRFGYEVPGGVAGRVLAKTTEPVLRTTIGQSLRELKKQVEARA